MKILFIHQNFPAQFVHLAPALLAKGHDVHVLTISKRPITSGIKVHRYSIEKSSSPSIHRWLTDLETKVIRGEAVFNAAIELKNAGLYPDAIIAHPGWGESLFIKDVWPRVRLGLYCEFYYTNDKGDVGFDPEFSLVSDDNPARLRMKNTNHILNMLDANRGISPTAYQRSVFPESFQEKIDVIHDGIDTQKLCPNYNVSMTLNGKKLTRDDEIITFVNRNLEPMRGYHIFMRTLPIVMQTRPNARVIIVGGDEVSYGKAPADGKTWKSIFLDEVRNKLDMSRIHFVGKLPYADFIQLLQLSRVHTYLTYPFVLSWSLLEAMSIGCAIVASDTAPVREAIRHNETGKLVDFFDINGLAQEIIGLLENPDERERLGQAARDHVVRNYDLASICLPKQIGWVENL